MRKQKSQRIDVPMISVNPNYISLYTDSGQFTGRSKRSNDVFYNEATGEVEQLGRTAKQIEAEKHLKDNDTKGLISAKAGKSINRKLSWFAKMSQKKVRTTSNGLVVKNNLSFITLTLSSKQIHDDQFIKNKMLNAFLVDIRRRFFVTSYFWRAEAQINGNMHFHIVINRYIHKTHISTIWNRIQQEHGYLNDYIVAKGHNKAPSTEIKAVYKCKNISGYLSKYCTKNLNAAKLNCTNSIDAVKQVVKETSGLLSVKFIKSGGYYLLKYDNSILNFEQMAAAFTGAGIMILNLVDCPLREIKGRQWFCSRTLSQLGNVVEVVTNAIEDDVRNILEKGVVKFKKIVKDYVTVLCFPVFDMVERGLFAGIDKLFYMNKVKWQCNENEAYLNLIT